MSYRTYVYLADLIRRAGAIRADVNFGDDETTRTQVRLYLPGGRTKDIELAMGCQLITSDEPPQSAA